MKPRAVVPILMYHKLSTEHRDRFTVSGDQFEWQLQYLQRQGYRSMRFGELLNSDDWRVDERAVMITFDDGYTSVADIAVPLLQRYGLSATCFIPVGCIGRDNAWDGGGTALMDENALRQLPCATMEIGLHSWKHDNFLSCTSEQIRLDALACRRQLDALGIDHVPVFAYPYGSVPSDPQHREQWAQSLKQAGVRMACRVGNRLNRLPFDDPMMLTRIEVRGDDARWKFRMNLALGKF